MGPPFFSRAIPTYGVLPYSMIEKLDRFLVWMELGQTVKNHYTTEAGDQEMVQ